MQTQATFPRWVDSLFSRLHIRYGDAWSRKWDGIPADALKADWHDQLARVVVRNPSAVTYALEHLPADFPPNSEQFLKLCLQQPVGYKALPAPVTKPNAAFAGDVRQRIRDAKPQTRLSPGEECAQRLEAKIARGEKLSYQQRAQLDAIRRMTGPSAYSGGSDIDRLADRKEAVAKATATYAQRVEAQA